MDYKAPTETELSGLLGEVKLAAWQELCRRIDAEYDMDRVWNSGGRRWAHEYKYRRGAKTLCAFYARQGEGGLLIILGSAEREKFETERENFHREVLRCYDEAATYHDGKWIMFPLDEELADDYLRILAVKRKPNRK